MIAINSDPHAEGFRFSPTHWATAVYKTRPQLNPIVQLLHAAGFICSTTNRSPRSS